MLSPPSSWSGSWRYVRRRAGSCRSTPTLFSSRSQTTALISWSRLSTPWRSLADSSDLRHNNPADYWSSHNVAEPRCPYLHPVRLQEGRQLGGKERKRGHYLNPLSSNSLFPSSTLEQTFTTPECFPVSCVRPAKNRIRHVHKVLSKGC